MAPPTSRTARARFDALVAASLLTLLLGYWLKARCLDHPWGAAFEFRNYCYNDLFPLYYSNGYADGLMPYVTARSEYPVLTGFIPWLLAQAFHDVQSWWHANAVLLLAAGIGVTVLLGLEGHDWRSAAPWALAPAIVVDGFTNWDLWAVFAMVAALVAFRRDRLLLCGLAVGLGTAAKLFPVVVGLAAVMVVANRARLRGKRPDARLYRDGGLLAGGFALGWLPVNLPFLLHDRAMWWATYQFHVERGTSFQTVYYLWDQYVGMPILHHAATTSEFNTWSTVVTVAGIALVGVFAWRRRTTDIALVAAALLATHVVASKFFSPQYVVWLLPMFVLAALPRWLWFSLTASHLAGTVWAYQFRIPPVGQTDGLSTEFLPPFNLASLALIASMAAMVPVAIRAMGRPIAARPEPPAPAPPRPPAGSLQDSNPT